MLVCKVMGNVVSTCKDAHVTGKKLLVVQEKQNIGTVKTMIAVDCVDAGIGDWVVVVHEGGSSRRASRCEKGAVDAAIVGVMDYEPL
jgi:ethanolamine utilization protein EutN